MSAWTRYDGKLPVVRYEGARWAILTHPHLGDLLYVFTTDCWERCAEGGES